jgi:hypothetical protein
VPRDSGLAKAISSNPNPLNELLEIDLVCFGEDGDYVAKRVD